MYKIKNDYKNNRALIYKNKNKQKTNPINNKHTSAYRHRFSFKFKRLGFFVFFGRSWFCDEEVLLYERKWVVVG